MIATILLVLRIGMSAVLYIFLGWAFYLLWRDFQAQTRLISDRKVPRLLLNYSNLEDAETFQYENTPVTIGRDPGCECFIDDRTVSNRHAQFSYHHNQWWLVDLGSTNGTSLNGQPVTEAVVLINGDQVQCGQVSLAVSIEQARSRRSPGSRSRDAE